MHTLRKKWIEWDSVLTVLGAIFLFFPIIFVGAHYSSIYANLFFQGATTTGTITSLGTGYIAGRSAGYTPRIRYTYQVNGIHHESRNLHFDSAGIYDSCEQARKVISHYQIGQRVTVHYDRRFPGVSALELKFNKQVWIIPIVSVLLGVFCVFIFKRCGYQLILKW